MSDISTLAVKLIPSLVRKIYEFGQQEAKINKGKHDLTAKLRVHYAEIFNWCKSMPFYGLSKAKKIRGNSLELIISNEIKKFSSKHLDSKPVQEVDILQAHENYIILGSPGSGKSTTIKRMIARFLDDNSEQFYGSVPLLVRLRELGDGETLFSKIAGILGFNVIYEEVRIKDDKGGRAKKVGKIGDSLLETFIPNILDHINAVLFIDGLDEVNESIKSDVRKECEELGIKTINSKIIITVRTGDFQTIFTNFIALEIKPLDSEQIKILSKKWLGNLHNDFYTALKKQPYYSISDRPIFLAFLMIIYDRYGYLPDQPSEVYRQVTMLILEEWDERRGIKRKTKYAQFGPQRKFKFLCDVAFKLFDKGNSKVFGRKELESIYNEIHGKYGLPGDEANKVIIEIESHNGILAESVSNKLEFSHLSIQEYLAAEYLNSTPFNGTITRLIERNSEILAVSVAISGDPSENFSFYFLNVHSYLVIKNLGEHGMLKFLTRLKVESPYFSVSENLGLAMIKLIFQNHSNQSIVDCLNDLISKPEVLESLILASYEYNIEEYFDSELSLSCKFTRKDTLYNPAARGSIYVEYYPVILKMFKHRLKERGH